MGLGDDPVREEYFRARFGPEKPMKPMPNPADLFHSYRSGWTDGAKAGAMNPQKNNHANKEIQEAYRDGYKDGYAARCLYGAKASVKYGYTPSPLRTES